MAKWGFYVGKRRIKLYPTKEEALQAKREAEHSRVKFKHEFWIQEMPQKKRQRQQPRGFGGLSLGRGLMGGL